MLDGIDIYELMDTVAVGIMIAVCFGYLVYRFTRKKGGCSCGSSECGSGKKNGECENRDN